MIHRPHEENRCLRPTRIGFWVISALVVATTACTPAPAAVDPVNNPYGAIDTASASGSSVTFSGWAADDDTASAINVEVSVAGRTQVLQAKQPRPDVHRAYGRGDKRGFSGRVDAVPDGAHQLCVVARNVAGGSNTVLGCRQVVVETVRGGYTRLGSIAGAAPSMDIYLHTSAAVLANQMVSAIAELSQSTSNTYAYRGLTSNAGATSGQIVVSAANTSGCDGVPWAGCASVSSSSNIVDRAKITIRPTYLNHRGVRGILVHELGHASGLGHFNANYLGSAQVMMAYMNGQTAFQRGDRNGLAYMGAEGRRITAATQTALAAPAQSVVIAD